jgi:hypothetical protein
MFSKLMHPAIKEVSGCEAPIIMRIVLSFPVWREGYYRVYNGRVYFQQMIGDYESWSNSPLVKARKDIDLNDYLVVEGKCCKISDDIRFYGYYLDTPNRALRATDDVRRHARSFTNQVEALRFAKEHGIQLNHVDRIDVYRTV